MKVYQSFQVFWDELTGAKPNTHGFHDWQVVQIIHTGDERYAEQKAEGQDELGFQPLSITMANPLTQATKRVLIKDVNDKLAQDFSDYCRKLYINELEGRFVNSRNDVFHAFTEYDSWEEFHDVWLEREGKSVFMHNIPLLFDHTSKIDYWTRKQTGQEVMPYQRLLITTYFTGKDRFFDFFIKNVDDAELERIKLLIQSRIGLNLDLLFQRPGAK